MSTVTSSSLMRKCTHVTIVTSIYSIWIRGAKLYFVFFRMIKLLNSVMGAGTRITQCTFIVSGTAKNVRTDLRRVST